MTTELQSGASGEPDNAENSVQIGQTFLNSAWVTGPHPAALAEIEVAEEIEPPTPAPSRGEAGDAFEDQVRMYLREIGTVPLLTWEGEKRLARAMEAGTFLHLLIRRDAETGAPPSVRAIYRELYGRLRDVYRFSLADARVDAPSAGGMGRAGALGAAGRHQRGTPARGGPAGRGAAGRN